MSITKEVIIQISMFMIMAMVILIIIAIILMVFIIIVIIKIIDVIFNSKVMDSMRKKVNLVLLKTGESCEK